MEKGLISKFCAIHPFWKDTLIFLNSGFFFRETTRCTGTWNEGPGTLELRWDQWPPETLSEAGDAYSTNNFTLTPISGKLKRDPNSLEKGIRAPWDEFPANSQGLQLVQLGCGPNRLPGWLNLDLPLVDIRKRLPWAPESLDALFLEHVIEHVSPPDAFRFMREAFRTLKPGGVLRLAFPDVLRIAKTADAAYLDFLKKNRWGDGTPGSAVAAIVTQHGHLGVWSEDTMKTVLESIGFKVSPANPGASAYPWLRKIECHGSRIGEKFNLIETCCLDAVKPDPRQPDHGLPVSITRTNRTRI